MPHLKWTLLLYKCIYGADTNMLWTDGRTDRQPDCQTDNLTDGPTYEGHSYNPLPLCVWGFKIKLLN